MDIISLKSKITFSIFNYFYPEILQDFYQTINILDVWYITDSHRLGGQKNGAKNLQRLVFSSLWCDFSA